MPRFLSVIVEESRSFKNLSVLSLAFKRLWNKGSRIGIILAIFFSAIEALLYAVNPVILRHLIDALSSGATLGWNKPLAHPIPFVHPATCSSAVVLLTIVMVVSSILWYAAFNTGTGFARNATYYSQVTFGTEAFAHILNLSMDFHVQSKKGEVLAQTDQTIQQAQDFIYNSFFMDFLRAGLSIPFILIVIYTIDWRLFVICAVTLSIGIYTNLVFGSRVSKEEKAAWKNVSEVQARALDVMQNIRETKVFGNEAFEADRRKEHAEKQLGPLRRVSLLWRKLTTAENLLQNSGFAVAMFFVILPGVFAHHFTIGRVVQFVTSYLFLFTFFMSMLFKYLNAQRLAPKLQDLKRLLDLVPLVKDRPGAVPFPGLCGEVAFQGIGFTYPVKKGTRPPVLKDANLALPKGMVTVIAGKTGCGKTTLANLLMRLYDPTTGKVLADGIDIRNYRLKSYHRAFAVLSQDAYLFNDSIAYNIRYSRIGASLDEIIEAAKIAQAHAFITQLPEGYNTIVSERSQNLSGGQKQRIALARAVLAKDAEIVILDEPTTGLDTETAREFLDELLQVFSGKTIVVITHDPTVMRRADQVVFMEDGRILQVGSHDELIKNCGSYEKLVSAV